MTELAVTWWGHSTASVEIGDVRVLTDPLLTDRLAHLRRHAAAVRREEAIEADLVVVSHLHLDHLHVPSLRGLRRGTTVLVPSGGGRLLRGLGLDVDELAPGDTGTASGVRIEATPAHHPESRFLGSRVRGAPLGFVMRGADGSVWYPGDTGLADHMDDVDDIDLALIPVGGWGPTLGEGHMGPEDAAEAVRRTGSRVAVPVHWGTFWPMGLRRTGGLFERLFRSPGQRFADLVEDAHTFLLGHGQSARVELSDA